MSDDLIHRDDLDMKDVAAIEQHFQELFHGMKVVFAGDEANLPEDVRKAAEELERQHHELLMSGKCLDCEVQMPNFPPDSEDWRPPDGWRIFKDQHDELMAWQCPECDAKEEAGE